MNRRDFLKGAVCAGAVVAAPKLLAQPLPNLDGWTHQTESIETVVTKETMEANQLASTSLSIKGWINSPISQEIEQAYKKYGSLPEDSSWDDFEIVDSNRYRETYDGYGVVLADDEEGPVSIENITYSLLAFGDRADYRLMRSISTTLYSLRVAAINTKIEGLSIGKGKLILQSRMDITIEDDTESKLGEGRRITWYGAVRRIANYKEFGY